MEEVDGSSPFVPTSFIPDFIESAGSAPAVLPIIGATGYHSSPIEKDVPLLPADVRAEATGAGIDPRLSATIYASARTHHNETG
jgi:hypothetical protein